MNSQETGKTANRAFVMMLDELQAEASALKTAPCIAVKMIRSTAAPIIPETDIMVPPFRVIRYHRP